MCLHNPCTVQWHIQLRSDIVLNTRIRERSCIQRLQKEGYPRPVALQQMVEILHSNLCCWWWQQDYAVSLVNRDLPKKQNGMVFDIISDKRHMQHIQCRQAIKHGGASHRGTCGDKGHWTQIDWNLTVSIMWRMQVVVVHTSWPRRPCLKLVNDLLHCLGECFFAYIITSFWVSASSWPTTTKSNSQWLNCLHPYATSDSYLQIWNQLCCH